MASLLLGAPPMAAAAASQFQTITIAPSLSFSNSLTLILSPIRLSYSISTSSSSAPTLPLVYCGRGDKKTEKGKRFRHSFGNSRPKNKKKGRGPPRVYAPPRKDDYENDEVVTFTEEEQLPFE
ncbi:30S ribosomal protein S31- chloroplastic [Striga hermonthica]|uniref:30S ribosomal protein S31- chloroplastic n=1 Tax=Striga hermonthica TaxID=68872 RepID=A0A9N7MWN9_STRHE|nr:30S ribosomal protein S31- chloroplastic [Striga hermonthica]